MKKVSSKKFTVLLAFGMSAITCMVCSLGGGMVTSAHEASAEEDIVLEQEEVIEDTIGDIDDGGISVTSTCTPDTPEVLYQYNADQSTTTHPNVSTYYETYNCFAAFPVQNVDNHATRLDFGKNNSADNVHSVDGIEKGEVYRLVAYPSSTTEPKTCMPLLYLVSAYCTSCKTRSAVNGVIFNNYNTGYNAQCRYGCTDKKITGTIPTSWNQSGTNLNKWAHGLSDRDHIYFSISCNGVVADGELRVPKLGYDGTEITLDGVTFTVRTGPSNLSIKASSAVTCNIYDTMFVFYCEEA